MVFSQRQRPRGSTGGGRRARVESVGGVEWRSIRGPLERGEEEDNGLG